MDIRIEPVGQFNNFAINGTISPINLRIHQRQPDTNPGITLIMDDEHGKFHVYLTADQAKTMAQEIINQLNQN